MHGWKARPFPAAQRQRKEQMINERSDCLTSTCRMGTDMRAVVGPDLKVHGMEGLRVIDASIFPAMTSSNTNAPTMMVAEKGADLALGHSAAVR